MSDIVKYRAMTSKKDQIAALYFTMSDIVHNASKECSCQQHFLNFMQGFKSVILAIFHFWQNGTFEPLHEIQIFFCQKHSFEAL